MGQQGTWPCANKTLFAKASSGLAYPYFIVICSKIKTSLITKNNHHKGTFYKAEHNQIENPGLFHLSFEPQASAYLRVVNAWLPDIGPLKNLFVHYCLLISVSDICSVFMDTI